MTFVVKNPTPNAVEEKKKDKYGEAKYWKYRKNKEIRSSRDRKHAVEKNWDDMVLTINSSAFLDAYTKNITPIVRELKPRTYAEIVKSGWY
jgi:hypothetical protein